MNEQKKKTVSFFFMLSKCCLFFESFLDRGYSVLRIPSNTFEPWSECVGRHFDTELSRDVKPRSVVHTGEINPNLWSKPSMVALLEKYWTPEDEKDKLPLQIFGGPNFARFTKEELASKSEQGYRHQNALIDLWSKYPSRENIELFPCEERLVIHCMAFGDCIRFSLPHNPLESITSYSVYQVSKESAPRVCHEPSQDWSDSVVAEGAHEVIREMVSRGKELDEIEDSDYLRSFSAFEKALEQNSSITYESVEKVREAFMESYEFESIHEIAPTIVEMFPSISKPIK